jgi:hypothetical protein
MAKRSIPMLSFVLETLLPDGPHWYEGYKRITAPKGAVIEGPQWTPYWEDAYKFDNTEHANAELEKVSGSVKGAYVCATEDALWKDAWIQVDELHYMIRAKYMQVGNRVLMAGHSHPFQVIKKDDNYFSLKDDAGGIVLIKRNSGKKVIVQTRPRKLY